MGTAASRCHRPPITEASDPNLPDKEVAPSPAKATPVLPARQPYVCQIALRSTEPFRILDLPPEMRNMVYAYCEDFQHPEASDPRRKAWHKTLRSTTITVPLTYFILTQVNQLIRHGYNPLYLANVGESIPLQKVETYFAAFHGDDFDVKDNITIDLDLITPRNARSDLLPIFRHLADHPNVECEFRSNHYATQIEKVSALASRDKILTRLAARSADPEFKTEIAKVAYIIPNGRTENIVFKIRKSLMPSTRRGCRDFKAAFRMKMSLDALPPWGVLIKFKDN